MIASHQSTQQVDKQYTETTLKLEEADKQVGKYEIIIFVIVIIVIIHILIVVVVCLRFANDDADSETETRGFFT